MKTKFDAETLERLSEQIMGAAYNKQTYYVFYNKDGRYDLETLKVALELRFPDSKIAIDPIKTYIYIDWS